MQEHDEYFLVPPVPTLFDAGSHAALLHGSRKALATWTKLIRKPAGLFVSHASLACQAYAVSCVCHEHTLTSCYCVATLAIVAVPFNGRSGTGKAISDYTGTLKALVVHHETSPSLSLLHNPSPILGDIVV